MNLTPDESTVLEFLADRREADVDNCGYCFASIAADTGLDRSAVRRACRSLKIRGLTEFHKVLWGDEGPVGAGYSATAAARAAIEAADA